MLGELYGRPALLVQLGVFPHDEVPVGLFPIFPNDDPTMRIHDGVPPESRDPSSTPQEYFSDSDLDQRIRNELHSTYFAWESWPYESPNIGLIKTRMRSLMGKWYRGADRPPPWERLSPLERDAYMVFARGFIREER